ncbi:type I-E CRISPR-associated protein Cas7/Cse4/CasC [Actinomadura kijaniata]|uniref:type I-E CRISPR-associated protein Cas7/Cse4/CasC n=1 Tax=Actinomadura kijaniata TaxID=46161 RepID=UPI000829AEAF|nr:type I-E CRISPR-associated protein Cas7/Cse4/CasC [Actinomadura kijaniata]
MIVELHILQSFAPSNLNRDDTGSPKSATFGGVQRARISSQCLKRTTRLALPDYGLTPAEVGVRTRQLANEAAALLESRDHDPASAKAVAAAALNELGLGVKDKTGESEYLLFVRSDAAARLADICTQHWDTLLTKAGGKKVKGGKGGDITELRELVDASRAVDVALFGRMISDNKGFNVEAASQVAHALSTHTATAQYDYYTAVDDLLGADKTGAGMIGTIEFNSACYYRYANLDLHQLTTNLDGDTDLAHRGTLAWAQAFIHAVPTGKQNSMAAHNPPSLILAVTRPVGTWNLANAFAAPIAPPHVNGAPSIVQRSAEALLAYYGKLTAAYGSDGHTATLLTIDADVTAKDITTVQSVSELITSIAGTLQ